MYLKQPLTPPQCKIIVAYHISNHRCAIEIGRWMTIPISRDTRPCHFASIIKVKVMHILCWNVTYINPLEISFHHYLKTQFQGASSFSFNTTIKLTLSCGGYHTPALQKIRWFETIMMYFQSQQPFQFPTLLNQIHFIGII